MPAGSHCLCDVGRKTRWTSISSLFVGSTLGGSMNPLLKSLCTQRWGFVGSLMTIWSWSSHRFPTLAWESSSLNSCRRAVQKWSSSFCSTRMFGGRFKISSWRPPAAMTSFVSFKFIPRTANFVAIWSFSAWVFRDSQSKLYQDNLVRQRTSSVTKSPHYFRRDIVNLRESWEQLRHKVLLSERTDSPTRLRTRKFSSNFVR
jgi:hypothetical protein